MIFVKTSQVHLSWDKQKARQDFLCACMCIFSLCHCSHICGCVFVFVFDDVCMFVKTSQSPAQLSQTKGPPRSGGDDPCTNTCTRSTNTNTSLTTLVILALALVLVLKSPLHYHRHLMSLLSGWYVASRRLSRFVGDCHESAHWTLPGGNTKKWYQRHDVLESS